MFEATHVPIINSVFKSMRTFFRSLWFNLQKYKQSKHVNAWI